MEVNLANIKLEENQKEKEFQKYVAFYFLKKDQKKEFHQKFKKHNNKFKEHSEKLEEVDRMNEENRKLIMKKMQKMERKRSENMKLKEERILEDKLRREAKVKGVKMRLTDMEEEEDERRKDILDYQTEMMNRSFKMNDAINNRKKFNAGEKSIMNQIAIQNNMMAFMKKLNMLKSQSISKKSTEKRIKLFKELKRQEAERKKREKEEELFNKEH